MNFNFKLTIPAETEQDEPEQLIMPMSYGIITQVGITIPDGHKETAKLRIKYHEVQLYPLNRGEWYKGDGCSIEFEDRFPFIVEPYELKAEGYNESTLYEHGFLMNFNVMLPEDVGWTKIPDRQMQKLYDLLGKDIEVGP